MNINFCELTAVRLAEFLRERRFTVTEVTSYFLERIHRAKALGAFSVVAEDAALEQAKKVDAMFASHRKVHPLQGVPLVLKDNIAWQGLPMELGSSSRKGKVSHQSAPIVKRLLEQGMVPLGKTQMTEYGFGLSGINPTTGTPRNPWDAKVPRLTGGSSSGAAVAVAAGLSPLALGADAGGSVRAPAAFHHLVGLKPSSCLIDQEGCPPLSHSLNTLGPIAHNVEETRALLSVLTDGSLKEVSDATLKRRLRLAVLDERAWPTELSSEVAKAWNEGLSLLRAATVDLEFWCPPQALLWSSMSHDTSLILAYEAYQTYHEVVDRNQGDIWSVVFARLKKGSMITDQAYQDALSRRGYAQQQFATAFADLKVDALLLPCCPFVAPPIEEYDEQNDALGLWLRAANFLNACAITLPLSLSNSGLPIAIQLMSPKSTDSQLLDTAAQIEPLFNQKGVRPDLSGWKLT